MKFTLKLNSISCIKRFVQLNSSMPFHIDVSSGRYIVDGKSIMGIFSIDTSKPIDCSINTENQDLIGLYKGRLAQIPEIEVMNIGRNN